VTQGGGQRGKGRDEGKSGWKKIEPEGGDKKCCGKIKWERLTSLRYKPCQRGPKKKKKEKDCGKQRSENSDGVLHQNEGFAFGGSVKKKGRAEGKSHQTTNHCHQGQKRAKIKFCLI